MCFCMYGLANKWFQNLSYKDDEGWINQSDFQPSKTLILLEMESWFKKIKVQRFPSLDFKDNEGWL
jgi:hypothetical protein